MGYWGVKSYENDDADFAIDAGLEKIHGEAYEVLMDDGNALSFDEAQKQLANPETLAAAINSLREEYGSHRPFDDWEEDERLAFAGFLVFLSRAWRLLFPRHEKTSPNESEPEA